MEIVYKPTSGFTKYQKQIFYSSTRWTLVEAAPQVGKTDLCICKLISVAIESYSGANLWYIAPVNKLAKESFNRAKRKIKRSKIPKELYKIKEQEQSIEFAGSGKIIFMTSDTDCGNLGIPVIYAVIDEASKTKEESYSLLLSRFAKTGGKAILISNVHGKLNWFYKLCRKAERGDIPDSKYFRIPITKAIEAGITNAENIEQIKNASPNLSRFEELYYCVAKNNSDCVFDPDLIQKSLIKQKDIKDTEVVLWGIDSGKKVDYTVITGVNRYRETIYVKRFQKSWSDTRRIILETIGNIPCVIDATGNSDNLVEDLQSERNNILPYIFTNKSKQNLIENLVLLFNKEEVKIVEEVSSDLILELDNFEYNFTPTNLVKYGTQSDYHDDCVCSLALAFIYFEKCVDMGKPLIAF